MKPSDFLMLISICVAVITVCEANDKKIWRYKFPQGSLLFGGLWLGWILYLIYYPSFVSRGMYFPIFESENGILSSTWAFVLAITLLMVIGYMIAIKKSFPKSQHDNLISYYRGLMFSDYNTLISYLEYYHNPNSLPHLARVVFLLKYKKNIGETLVNRIRREIIYDHYFIEKIVSISPSLFLEYTTSYYSSQDDDTITANEYFAKCLIKEFNYKFFDAISLTYKKCNDVNKCKMTDAVEENLMLRNLFYDKRYFTHIQLLQVFRDVAYAEITNHNSIIYQARSEDFYKAYCKSALMQYLMLYIITIEHILDTLHKNKGKAPKHTFDCIESILELNPSCLLSHLSHNRNKFDTFYNYLQEEIEDTVFSLVYYCENHNYPDRIKYALSLWLQLFHPDVEIGTTNKDVERLSRLVLEGEDKWPNCSSSIRDYISILIDKQNKQTKKSSKTIMAQKHENRK